MHIPKFLRPESYKYNSEAEKMHRLVNEYKLKVGDDLITEPSTYTDQEWINMLQECIDKKMSIWELFGEEYNKEMDY